MPWRDRPRAWAKDRVRLAAQENREQVNFFGVSGKDIFNGPYRAK